MAFSKYTVLGEIGWVSLDPYAPESGFYHLGYGDDST
jgi:hypothetical protein